MTIAKQIQEIIEKRNQQAHNVKNVLENWQKQKVALKKLEYPHNHLNGDSEDNFQISEHSNSMNLSKLIRQIDRELEELKNLHTRLSRPTLNIGVVGRMRQGKSKLLQTLTGLTDIEIPTSSEGVCTRTLSKIFHVNNPDEVRNEVHFHSSSSFQEIIHLYFDKLDLPDPRPIVPDDLDARKFPPPLPPKQAQNNKSKFDYGRLCREHYHKYDRYKSLLDAQLKYISKEDIKQYTTQIQGNENTSNGEYLAVRELNIYCQFPDQDQVGKIGVIDLPGLGDDSVSDTELLIKTLKQDIDFILFVRRPDLLGADWEEADRDMYKIACDALGDFPINKCSFMLFNKTKLGTEDNFNLCKQFQASIDLQEINVTDSVIADCSNPDDVKTLVLTRVIKELTKNINYVYEQYVDSCNKRLEKIRTEIFQYLEEKARKALERHNQQGGKGFNHWFDQELYPRLTGKIYQKRDQLNQKSNEADTLLEEKVNKVVERCKENSIIPSESKIINFRNAYGDSYKIAYYMSINEVKEKLTDEFKSIAKALTESEKNLQLSVVEILSDDGDLKKLTPQGEIEFFDEIVKQMPADTDKLMRSFQEIKKSTDTYEDIIIRWIQPHLNELKPDKHTDPISQNQRLENKLNVTTEELNELKKTVNLTPEETTQLQDSLSTPNADLLSDLTSFIMKLSGVPLPDELNQKIARFAIDQISSSIGRVIRNHKKNDENSIMENGNSPSLTNEKLIGKEINALRHKVVNDCEQTLRKNLSFPNEEAYSKFDKFMTQAFKGVSAKIEWRNFYQDEKNQSILWSGAEQKEKNKQLEQKWQKLVDRAMEANKPDALLLSKS